MDNSFFSSGQAVDTFYDYIRDNPDRKDARDFVEGLWQKYYSYAEPDFLKNAREDFHAKAWEMYLGCLFLAFNFNLQKKTKRKGLIYTCFGTIVQYGLRQLRRNREPVIMQSRSINIMKFLASHQNK